MGDESEGRVVGPRGCRGGNCSRCGRLNTYGTLRRSNGPVPYAGRGRRDRYAKQPNRDHGHHQGTAQSEVHDRASVFAKHAIESPAVKGRPSVGVW